MIGITPEKVSREIAAVCAVAHFNEHIRAHMIDESDLSGPAGAAGAAQYVEARRHIADALQWKVFSHCASVTRLYALYEGFVYGLISAWLKILPSLYSAYAGLPEAILNQHRVGVGVLLQKYGLGSRTENLTELSIVDGLYSGLNGQQTFRLLADAFFIDLRNLKHEELCGLFSKASLKELSSWLDGHTDLRAMCEAAGTTPAGRLKELVEFRNEASHAREEIDETMGVSALQEMADFINGLCVALHQFVSIRYVDVLQEGGRLELLGKVTEYLEGPEAAILTTAGAVRVGIGDEVVVRGRWTCFSTKITSLQDHDNAVESAEVAAQHELGVKFEQKVDKVGASIFRLKPTQPVGEAPATLR